jgi:transposase InsO family protein
MGKVMMAQMLCRAGLHIGKTTVGRILKEEPAPAPKPDDKPAAGRVVTSRYPNHLWLIDLTVLPTGGGFWCSWFPGSLPQRFPFGRWVGIIVDHFSRRVQGFVIFDHEPSSVEIRAFLGRTIRSVGSAPRHLISDKGPQFWPCQAYRGWCRRHDIRPRFGAVGKHGSIAVVERVILTTKQLLGELPSIPTRRRSLRRELAAIFSWYNEHRPNTALAGSTPNEVYFRRRHANRRPRLEPRERWPRRSPCARPQTLVAGQPGDRFRIRVDFHEGRPYLPIVSLRRAA